MHSRSFINMLAGFLILICLLVLLISSLAIQPAL